MTDTKLKSISIEGWRATGGYQIRCLTRRRWLHCEWSPGWAHRDSAGVVRFSTPRVTVQYGWRLR